MILFLGIIVVSSESQFRSRLEMKIRRTTLCAITN